jgi:NTP pyrophosphatase (non-canonical NTP hydrolase)
VTQRFLEQPAKMDIDQAPKAAPSEGDISLRRLQDLIRTMYYEKDVARGIEGTFMWLMEEVGELSAALRHGSHEDRMEEFADVVAWLATIANVAQVDLSDAIARKYGSGCPGCGEFVCRCDNSGKP